MKTIDSFKGEYAWLSNFYPCWISMDNDMYPTLEHAYQASKTLKPRERELILQAKSPGLAKVRGRAATLRKDWPTIQKPTMRLLLSRKFTNDNKLGLWLMNTGDAYLIEGNQHGDTFWGVCDGVGENNLGQMLMARRLELVKNR